jgi:uncharacterized repeat protein (TIGR01451 family)
MEYFKLVSLVALSAIVGLFAGAPATFAQDPSNGETVTITDGCMQDVAGFDLNCTANDVAIASATNISITDPCEYPGDSVTFTADFEIVTTAVERHDIGIYFSIDGDPSFCENDPAIACVTDQDCVDAGVGGDCISDGAYTGDCSISTLPYAPSPTWLDLDGTDDDPGGVIQDTCGDISKKGFNNLTPTVTITAVCVDQDGDGNLDLPYCTSWRQFGANELCLSPLDAFPGSPSKCRCDLGFNVPVPVPPANLTVTKTPNPPEIPEPGGLVTYTITISNASADPNNYVTLDQLTDSPYGNLLDSTNPNVSSNTCLTIDEILDPGETETCTFQASVSGDAGYFVEDTVTASGLDVRDIRVSGSATARVDVTDVPVNISVTKEGSTDWVNEPGGSVTFTVVVTAADTNVSTDDVTITYLNDSIHGDLSSQGTCTTAIGTVLAAGQNYTCSFTADVTGNAGYSETDIVTAKAEDNEDNEDTDDASWLVEVRDVAPTIQLTKTANDTEIDEPGDDVTFTFVVTNLSFESVTITSLTDSIHGDLSDDGTCTTAIGTVLAPAGDSGDSYTCDATFNVAGNAGYSETNVAEACAEDNDGSSDCDDDSETVTIKNVPPEASLVKTATSAWVSYRIEVNNLSAAEALDLTALTDTPFGNLLDSSNTNVRCISGSLDCCMNESPPISIGIGQTFTCTFEGQVFPDGLTNTATGTVADDDEGSPSIDRSDTATVSLVPCP